jgi:sRNA-binding protein
MGCWLPWDPSDHLMDNVEYANQQLNEIMRKYKENEANRELFFAEEREAAIKAQKDENAKRKADAEKEKVPSVMDTPAVHPSEGAIRD